MTTQYSPEQKALIDEAIQKAKEQQKKTNGWLFYRWSDRLVQRGEDRFAVFGSTAYHLTLPPHIEDEGGAFDYIPVEVDGRMFLQEPEEGHSGLLYLMRCTRRRQTVIYGEWMTAYLGARWLHTHELELSNAEILDNIAAEVEAGENVLTRKLPGWD